MDRAELENFCKRLYFHLGMQVFVLSEGERDVKMSDFEPIVDSLFEAGFAATTEEEAEKLCNARFDEIVEDYLSGQYDDEHDGWH